MTEQFLIKQLKELGKTPTTIFPATVKENYPGKDVITVVSYDGVEYINVRKRAEIGLPNEGILVTPAKNSTVLVARIMESNELYVALFSKIHSIVFNGGINGGMVIAPTLKEELDKNNALLQAIIDVISGEPILEPGNEAQSALQTSLKLAIINKSLGDFSSIENEIIKH